MKSATWVMIVLAIVLCVIAYLKSSELPFTGLKAGGKMFVSILPILIVSFAVAGLMQVLIPKDIIAKWLGTEAGFKSIMIGCVAGALTPGAPYITFPLVAGFYKAGASIGAVVGFVAAWSLWQVYRIPLEVALIGPKVAIVRFLSTLIFPPIAGIFAQTFFGK
ncbi:MAG: permease [Candidatus Zixiibacteriota bacterium]